MKYHFIALSLFSMGSFSQVDGEFINSGGTSLDGFSYAVGEIFVIEKKDPEEEIAETNTWINVRAYPNPSSNIVYLNIDGELENREVYVYDINGRIVTTVLVSESSVDFTAFPNGVYLIVSPSEEFETIKIIKK